MTLIHIIVISSCLFNIDRKTISMRVSREKCKLMLTARYLPPAKWCVRNPEVIDTIS